MPQPYNMTEFSTANNFYDMFVSINTTTGNWLVYLLVMSGFTIMLIGLLRNNPPAESMFAASFSTTIFCLILMLANLISVVWVIGFTLILSISAVSLYLTNKAR